MVIVNEIQLKDALSIKDIEKELDFSIREKILYFMLGLSLPKQYPTASYFKLGDLKLSAKESVVELVSIYYTKIQDRKFKKLEIMFDYVDKKYSNKQVENKDNIYESNSQALKDYQNQLEKIIKLPTQENRDIALQEYLETRLVNYPEFLTFFDKNPFFLNENNEIVYTYLNKNFPLFFKYVVGLHSKKDINDFKKEYKPNLKDYKNFIKTYSSQDNKLSFALNQQSIPIFIPKQAVLEYHNRLKIKENKKNTDIAVNNRSNTNNKQSDLDDVPEIKTKYDTKQQNTTITIPSPQELEHEEKTQKEKENFLDSLF